MDKLFRCICAVVLVATAYGAHAADPGVTSNSILIGQSAAFSGPAMELGAEMRAGALAYFQAINAAGGVNGRKIELRSLDDGYEPDRAAANTKKLIDDGVFLLFGYVGTPTSNASKPIFTAAKVDPHASTSSTTAATRSRPPVSGRGPAGVSPGSRGRKCLSSDRSPGPNRCAAR